MPLKRSPLEPSDSRKAAQRHARRTRQLLPLPARLHALHGLVLAAPHRHSAIWLPLDVHIAGHEGGGAVVLRPAGRARPACNASSSVCGSVCTQKACKARVAKAAGATDRAGWHAAHSAGPTTAADPPRNFPIELHTAADPGARQPHQGRLDHVLPVDGIVLVVLVLRRHDTCTADLIACGLLKSAAWVPACRGSASCNECPSWPPIAWLSQASRNMHLRLPLAARTWMRPSS